MRRHDWRAVPKALRDQVWRTWQSGRGAGSNAHIVALGMAVTAVSSPQRRRLTAL